MPNRRAIVAVGMAAAIAAPLAWQTRARRPESVLSYRSLGSVLSASSLFSIASAASLLSIGSFASVLSIGSSNSVLSVGSDGGFLSIGRSRAATKHGGVGREEAQAMGLLPAESRMATIRR
jgi:hypothetical protein